MSAASPPGSSSGARPIVTAGPSAAGGGAGAGSGGAGGGGAGTGGNGGDTGGDRGNPAQRFVREWIAPSALAAIVLGIVGWLLVDKFDSIKDQIAEVRKVAERLDQRLSDAEKANLAVNSLLHNESKDLVDRINNTNTTVNTISGDVKAQSQKIDSLVSSVATLQSSITPLTALPELVRSIDARTARMEDLLRGAPPPRRQ